MPPTGSRTLDWTTRGICSAVHVFVFSYSINKVILYIYPTNLLRCIYFVLLRFSDSSHSSLIVTILLITVCRSSCVIAKITVSSAHLRIFTIHRSCMYCLSSELFTLSSKYRLKRIGDLFVFLMLCFLFVLLVLTGSPVCVPLGLLCYSKNNA